MKDLIRIDLPPEFASYEALAAFLLARLDRLGRTYYQANYLMTLAFRSTSHGQLDRVLRGLAIAALGGVREAWHEGYYHVASSNGGHCNYLVILAGNKATSSCSCPDFQRRGKACKHMTAALLIYRCPGLVAECSAILADEPTLESQKLARDLEKIKA